MKSYFKYQIIFENEVLGIYYVERQDMRNESSGVVKLDLSY